MRVIKMADVLGAAGDYLGGYREGNNWDGCLMEGIDGDGISPVEGESAQSRPSTAVLEVAPIVSTPRRLMVGGRRR